MGNINPLDLKSGEEIQRSKGQAHGFPPPMTIGTAQRHATTFSSENVWAQKQGNAQHVKTNNFERSLKNAEDTFDYSNYTKKNIRTRSIPPSRPKIVPAFQAPFGHFCKNPTIHTVFLEVLSCWQIALNLAKKQGAFWDMVGFPALGMILP